MSTDCPCAAHTRERELLDRIRVLADENNRLVAELTGALPMVHAWHDSTMDPCPSCRTIREALAAKEPA